MVETNDNNDLKDDGADDGELSRDCSTHSIKGKAEQYQTLPMKRNPKGTSYYSVAKLNFHNDTMLQLNQWAMISLMSPL